MHSSFFIHFKYNKTIHTYIQAGKNMNEKLIEKMIIKSFQQYQCSPISKEDQEMLVKHIQTVTHSNIEIDLYEEIEDIVYDYVTGKQ
ncbi:hypothetical protein bthur0004_39770 [Bacillus thuringiensis serovar sotto str. T04001]|nr:hypothetical protein bthur0004_39770 [Bacillus thuringiensis serovar sotto str. T04001]